MLVRNLVSYINIHSFDVLMKDRAFYSKIGKRGIKLRWKRVHSAIKFPPQITKEKASLHAYLCGDGTISMREERKTKRVHYEIIFFPDDLLMLENFQKAFSDCYGIMPTNIKKEGKMYRLRINNKVICRDLLKLGKYDAYNWTIPKEIKDNFIIIWLSCFFDCEAYVNINKRMIQVKSVNSDGLKTVKNMLDKLNISSNLNGLYNQKNGSPYSVLTISKREDIKKYSEKIGFNHSEKVKKLYNLLNTRPDGPMVRRK